MDTMRYADGNLDSNMNLSVSTVGERLKRKSSL